MKKVRIDKFLSNFGLGSRKEVRKYLKQERITVNDEVVKNPSFHINPETDTVKFDDEILSYKEDFYYMFNKPQGYITATKDASMPTVMDFFQDVPFHSKLFPVGRLDIDTEGLLFITTDGQFAHRLTHPKWEVEKEYYAVVKGSIKEENLDRFKEKGIYLKKDKYQTKPFEIKVLSKSSDKSEINITVKEGKYHIVKKIMEEIGNPVLYLKRVRIGPVKLDERLSPGEFRELTEEEIRKLKQAIKLP
ncbi:MAG: rRNA pseudouridine synthase [Aquificae bacterium]|nr:rRNA pseudouridine synthase [Aquificota bacterium]